LPAGSVGELVLSGEQVAQGYFDDPALTASRFVRREHPDLGTAVWYHTGDLAVQDELGNFHHLGRLDHQVKLLGHRIELEELDAHLRQVCCSDAVAAVAWPMVNGAAEGLIAFFADSPVDAATVFDGLRQRIPAYMMPGRVIKLDSLAHTPNGKVDRKALVRALEQGAYADPP
jgi:D-alanine--poly(phosphoribitol) ligase subunit 1